MGKLIFAVRRQAEETFQGQCEAFLLGSKVRRYFMHFPLPWMTLISIKQFNKDVEGAERVYWYAVSIRGY